MRSAAVHQRDLSISDLIALVDSGAVALPDFQRPFEWKTQQVQSLIATILMGWPAGSLLLMEAPPTDFFAVRQIDGGPVVSHETTRHLVLDGQQRITSVYQAFSPKSTSLDGWYIDLERWKDMLDVDSLESALFQSKHSLNSPLRVPLAVLSSDNLFLNWRESALSTIDDDLRSRNYERLNALWQERFSHLKDYSFSSKILDRSMPLPSVSKIFERLNTSGMSLGTFDLVVAHVYRDGRNLRSIWDKLVGARPSLAAFAARDPQVAIEVVALTSRGDTRRDSLLALDSDELWNSWPKTVAGLEAAADFLISEAGIAGEGQLPHRAIYLVLAALATELDLRDHIVPLRQWIFASAFTSRFDAAVNTRVVRDYRMLTESLKGRRPFRAIVVDSKTISGATRRGASSAWLGMQALLRWNGAQDLPLGLIGGLPIENSATPVSVVRFDAAHTRAYDPVAGMILSTRHGAELIEHRGAAVLGRILAEALDPKTVAEYCDSQLLPVPGDSAYESDEEFIKRRASLLEGRIRGMSSASALDVPGTAGRALSQADILTEIAASKLSIGEVDAAVSALRSVLTIRAKEDPGGPAHAQDAINLASALSMGGKSREAISVLESALDEDRVASIYASQHRLTLLDAIAQELLRVGDFESSGPVVEELYRDAVRLLGPESAVANRARASLIVFDLARGREDVARRRWNDLSDLVERSAGPWRLGDYATQVFEGLIELGLLERARVFRDWPALGEADSTDPSSIRFRQRSLGV